MGLASMTGFGSATATEGSERVSVEVKSVNGKFCEAKVRLPRELAPLETELVRVVKDRVARGNLDVSVRRASAQGPELVPVIDARLVAALAQAARDAAGSAGISAEFSIRDLLAVEGVVRLEERAPELEAAGNALRSALDAALLALRDVRLREGAALETDLRTRLAKIRALSQRVGELAPASVAQYRERLHKRIEELAPDLAADPRRLELEVVMFADRTDVAEELTRLAAHLEEFERLLARAGPVGRQLDFLIQEIHREVNTTGSKSQAVEVAQLVVELKTEVERIREQVQNVE